MRITNTAFIFMIAAAACMGAAQNQTLGSGSFTYGQGIKVQYVTVAEPALKTSQYAQGGVSESNVMHRWISDKSTHSYFGYDVIVEPIAGTTQCRVSILPLSLTAADIAKHYRSEVDSDWRPLQLPRYPAPQVVEPGDTIALDLLVSLDGAHKVVDYLKASCKKDTPSAAAAETSSARDMTLDDVSLNVDGGSLYINGEMAGTPSMGDAAGAIVWFYFPGKGRFLVSVVPHPGFENAGTIRDHHISFETGGNRYEVRASHPIVNDRHTFNAYVMFDSSYRPEKQNAGFGSADSVEKALAQK